MAMHHETGKKGEALAMEYFIGNGYTIMHKNWRYKHWEVDIIASKAGILHFIEVKTRNSLKFGYPEENVDERKLNKLISAAEQFLYQFPEWQRIQFDILAINIDAKTGNPAFFLIEDVYL